MRVHQPRLKDIARYLSSGRIHVVKKGGPLPNPDHFHVLSQGIEIWNQWRGKNPRIQPDLTGIMFVDQIPPGAVIEGAILSIPDLHKANFVETNFYKASFWEVELNNANLKVANLADAHFFGADLKHVDLSGANLTKTRFNEVDLTGAILLGVDLREANFDEAELLYTDFRGANLSGARLCGVNLEGSHFSEGKLNQVNFGPTRSPTSADNTTNLQGVQFIEAELKGANLAKANLKGANFHRVQLQGADLRMANLTEANLYEANLNGANLSKADLSGANLNEADFTSVITQGTVFVNVDLSKVRGLETVQHRGPSAIDITTIYRSNGEIPKVFLQKAGTPDEVIDYLERIKTPECRYTHEQLNEWIRNEQQHLTTINRSLNLLKEKKAKYGLDVPLHIEHEIHDYETERAKTEDQLAEYQRLKTLYYP